MDRIIRATTDYSKSQREINNANLSREMCEEGIVLLKNENNVLPLKTNNVDLFGEGALYTCFGGKGSGDCHPRYSVSIYEGLMNSPISVCNNSYFSELENEYEKELKEYKDKMDEYLSENKGVQDYEYKLRNPFTPSLPITSDIKKFISGKADTAIYVIKRDSGESEDRKLEEGDYYLTEKETIQIMTLANSYKHLVVILNVPSQIDLGFSDLIKMDAILLCYQGGMEMGNAVANVLSGKVSPSGKLANTWTYKYSDYPYANEFATVSLVNSDVKYKESIYVGYRYFDSIGKKVRYPFGYGLSYSEFRCQFVRAEQDGNKLNITINVSNVGYYPAKHVVELYLIAPRGRIKKETKTLQGFVKTGVIEPKFSEEVVVSLDFRNMYSYDYIHSCKMLERGSYIIVIGDDVTNTKPICGFELEKDIVLEKCKNVCKVKESFETLSLNANYIEYGVKKIKVDPSLIETKDHNYILKETFDEKIEEIANKLSQDKLIELIIGNRDKETTINTVFGMAGKTTSSLYEMGIPDLPMADGPQGLRLKNTVTEESKSFLSFLSKKKTSNTYYQFATFFPSETMMASTWNKDLLYKEGEALATEMEEFGVAYLLAPAMNIQRNPLGGRNFEYYSEDPVLSGMMASEIVKGVQSHKGCYATLKHFACNNQESNRLNVDTIVDERALREIYLRGFEIAIRESRPSAVMSSYNVINGVPASNSFDLLTNVLRNEWGFDGIVMTDWGATGHDNSLDEIACKCGCDLLMPGSKDKILKIKKAIEMGQITIDDVKLSAKRVLKQAYYSFLGPEQTEIEIVSNENK